MIFQFTRKFANIRFGFFKVASCDSQRLLSAGDDDDDDDLNAATSSSNLLQGKRKNVSPIRTLRNTDVPYYPLLPVATVRLKDGTEMDADFHVPPAVLQRAKWIFVKKFVTVFSELNFRSFELEIICWGFGLSAFWAFARALLSAVSLSKYQFDAKMLRLFATKLWEHVLATLPQAALFLAISVTCAVVQDQYNWWHFLVSVFATFIYNRFVVYKYRGFSVLFYTTIVSVVLTALIVVGLSWYDETIDSFYDFQKCFHWNAYVYKYLDKTNQLPEGFVRK